MKVTKLTTEQQLVDLLKECYPNLPSIVVRVVTAGTAGNTRLAAREWF